MKIKARIYWISLAIVFTCMVFVLILKANRSDEAYRAEKIEFCLMDSFGRQVSSQDYEGVPVFLEFGACW